MGGLKKYMPVTYKTFYVASLAIAGVPFFSGFFSKDEIIWQTWDKGGIVLWLVLAVSALMTAFYMFRLVNLVFHGEERFDSKHLHPHESPKTMTIPLIILAILSAFGGFLGIPYVLGFWFSHSPNFLENFLHPIFYDANVNLGFLEGHHLKLDEYLLMLLSVAIALISIWTAYRWYYYDKKWETPRKLVSNFKMAFNVLFNKYYVDEIYFRLIVDPLLLISRTGLWKFIDVQIIDGIVNGLAKVTLFAGERIRKMQTGFAQTYAVIMLAGAIVLITILFLSI
jgi:NADH-quinone oxidoreductase subunit L